MAVLDPRNIVADGPDVFSRLAALSYIPLPSSAEGSPIYLTIDAEVAVSGSYTVGTVTYSYTGTTSVTQRTRESIRTDAAADTDHYEITRDHDPSSWADIGVIISATANTFSATQWNVLGCNGGTPPFAPPTFLLAPSIIEYIDGTATDTAPDPDTENPIPLELNVFPPTFTGTIAGGDLKMLVKLRIVENGNAAEIFTHEIDASAWTSLDFRDIRGTYGTTSYDANGIEYIWSVTVG